MAEVFGLWPKYSDFGKNTLCLRAKATDVAVATKSVAKHTEGLAVPGAMDC